MKAASTFTLLALSLTLTANAQTFGGAVAATDDAVFVGETGNLAFAAEVYIYERAQDWAESGRLKVSDEAERFGRALAVQDDVLLVGASAANASSGAVYVFTKDDGGAWTHTSTLTASDAAEGDQFGSTIALDGTTVLISALGRSDGAGAVYVFSLSEDGTFTEAATLTGGSESFGSVMALQGHTALMGSPAANERLGVVYVFERDPDTGVFAQTGMLEPDSGIENGRFGSSLALHGDMAFVGVPGAAQSQGLVNVYQKDEDGMFAALAPLRAFEPQRAAMFGSSLAFVDDVLWVGSPGENQAAGALYRFQRRDDDWGMAERQRSTQATTRARFGNTLAVHGAVAVTGATGVDRREGAAVVLTHDGAWNEHDMVVNDIKSFDMVTGGEVRCAEGIAADWSCDQIDLVAFVPLHEMGGGRGAMSNDIWGWTDPADGREYALVGRSDGTSFVDVTVPEMPRYVGDLPMTAGSRANAWRDIKVFKDHAYVVADGAGEHGMQVFDLAQLREVTGDPMTFTETALYEGIHSAHNIVINEVTGFAYAVGASGGGETCGGGLHMIDIRDPRAPTFAGCFADASTGRRKTGYSHDAQCVVYHGPDAEHQGKEICIGSNETALSIADVTDKDNPVALSMAVYPKVAYAHQGWLTDDHSFFYMNDEGDEPQQLVEGTRTLVWDVTDLEDPILVHEYVAETTTTDHNLYIKGNLMYQSNYGSGLRILDITEPVDPVEVGFFDTTPGDGGGGSWSNYPYFESGVIIVTSMGEGLFVLKQRPADT